MNMKSVKFLCLFIMASVVSFNIAAQDTAAINGTVSLKQCVDIAIKNNLDVNNAEFLMEVDKVNWQLAKGNMLPFLSANIDHGLSQGRGIDPFTNVYVNQNITYANYGVNGSIYLWNGSSIQNNIRANRFGYEASKMDWQQAKDNITISVLLAYLQVLNNEEQLNAAEQQAEVTRKQAERLQILNNDGAIAPSDYYNMKGQLAGDELSVVNANNALETSRLELCRLMNIPYTANMQLEKTEGPLTPVYYDGTTDVIYAQALQQLAFVRAAELRKQSATFAVKSAKGQMLPSLLLNGSLGTNYSSAAATSAFTGSTDVITDNYVLLNSEKLRVYAPQNNYISQKITYGNQWKNNFNSSVSIGLRIPILNGLQARSRVSQAKITEKRAYFNEKTTRIQLRQNIDQAYLNMTAAFDRYQKLQLQSQAYVESFHAAEVKFNAGALTSVDYLIVKGNLDRANTNLIAAKYDYILRTKVLDFYRGQLSF